MNMKVRNELAGKFLVAFAGLAMLLLVSGCANTGFQNTSGATLEPTRMQQLVLRSKYPENVAAMIPPATRESYEAAFFKSKTSNVKVISKDVALTTTSPYYYLDTEVIKYKPGSPAARELITPVIAFGLWGSYVDVKYSISDPTSGNNLGNGVIRQANLWGGKLGGSITAETQLEDCPKEIMKDLDAVMKKQ